MNNNQTRLREKIEKLKLENLSLKDNVIALKENSKILEENSRDLNNLKYKEKELEKNNEILKREIRKKDEMIE